MKRNKCFSISKEANYCDGCSSRSTKCPLRNKTRDFRNRKEKSKIGYKGGFCVEIKEIE